MKLHRIASFVLLAASSWAALGQPVNPFLGKWNVTWSGVKQARSAKLVITESGGSWQPLGAKPKKNPCAGLDAPISIESSSATKIVMKVKLSEILSGCSDSKVVLIRADDGTITGKHGKSDLAVSRD